MHKMAFIFFSPAEHLEFQQVYLGALRILQIGFVNCKLKEPGFYQNFLPVQRVLSMGLVILFYLNQNKSLSLYIPVK